MRTRDAGPVRVEGGLCAERVPAEVGRSEIRWAGWARDGQCHGDGKGGAEGTRAGGGARS